MKPKLNAFFFAPVLLALAAINCQLSTARAQGTAFTYQGRLNDGGAIANGSYDLTFSLFATNTGGVAVAGPVTNSATAVSNGLFTVLIDLGPSAFTGGSNWLEIAVRTNSASSFITLAPRQQLTPAPYAIMAESANYLPGLTVRQNASGAPDVIGGASDNFVSSGVVGATIPGGGATNYPIIGIHGTTNYVSYTNSVTGDFGTVSGGALNTAAKYATVGGGSENSATGRGDTVGGGDQNTASGIQYSTVSGGEINTASGEGSTVSGGANNTASGSYSTIPGGGNNLASGIYSFAAGVNAQATNNSSFVWSDNELGTTFASTTNNQFSVRASGGIRLVGDVQIDNSAYHYLSLDGGNSLGFLYGSYPAFGDGVHFGYNYYADAGGTGHVINTGGGTSRISAGYGYISLLTGGAGGAPYQGLTVSGGSVNVSTSLGIYIGSATPQATIDLYGDIIYRGNGIWNAGISSSGSFGFTPGTSGADVAYIDTSGNYHQSSDRRLKGDITNLDNTLERLLKLRPVSYHFHDGPTNAPLSLGFIAQEVQPLFPELVGEQTNGVKDLVYSELIPVAIRSIQELNQKLEKQVEQRDAEIQALKQSNDALSNRLKDLQTAVQELQQKN